MKNDIVSLVRDTLVHAGSTFREDKKAAYRAAIAAEKSEKAKWVLETVMANAEAAERDHSPLCDDTGIPKTAADRLKVFDKVMAKAKEYDIAPNRIHIDPLIEMLCTADDGEGISMVIEVMTKIKEQYPTIHITGAVSNISFNLPKRKLVNQAFTVLAMNAGLDSAVFDPLNTDLQGMIFATEAMLGLDDLCCEYMSAYREGRFGEVK